MSFLVAGYVSNNRPQGLAKAETLTQPETHLMLILASHGNDNGGGIWPSYNTLALSMKSERRTVISWMNSLIKKKYVIKRERSENNKSLTNQYYLNVNKLRAECCKKPQRFDDEMNPFEAEVGVIHDHQGSDLRSPQGCSTITPPVIHDHPNNQLTSIEQPNNKDAGACATVNPNAKAFVEQLLLGDERKRKERRLPPAEVTQEPPFRVEPHTPEPYDKELQQEMLDAGLSSASCRAFFRAYTVDKIRTSLSAMMQYQKTKPIRSVGGWLKHYLENPFEIESKPIAKPSVALIESEKLLASMKAREKELAANRDNPEANRGKVQLLKDALKKGRCDSLRTIGAN
jgi:hypothetical protein